MTETTTSKKAMLEQRGITAMVAASKPAATNRIVFGMALEQKMGRHVHGETGVPHR